MLHTLGRRHVRREKRRHAPKVRGLKVAKRTIALRYNSSSCICSHLALAVPGFAIEPPEKSIPSLAAAGMLCVIGLMSEGKAESSRIMYSVCIPPTMASTIAATLVTPHLPTHVLLPSGAMKKTRMPTPR